MLFCCSRGHRGLSGRQGGFLISRGKTAKLSGSARGTENLRAAAFRYCYAMFCHIVHISPCAACRLAALLRHHFCASMTGLLLHSEHVLILANPCMNSQHCPDNALCPLEQQNSNRVGHHARVHTHQDLARQDLARARSCRARRHTWKFSRVFSTHDVVHNFETMAQNHLKFTSKT